MKANTNFVCAMCGKHDDFPSYVDLIAGYGSTKHDGDVLSICVCGDCIDKLFDAVQKNVSKESITINNSFGL